MMNMKHTPSTVCGIRIFDLLGTEKLTELEAALKEAPSTLQTARDIDRALMHGKHKKTELILIGHRLHLLNLNLHRGDTEMEAQSAGKYTLLHTLHKTTDVLAQIHQVTTLPQELSVAAQRVHGSGRSTFYTTLARHFSHGVHHEALHVTRQHPLVWNVSGAVHQRRLIAAGLDSREREAHLKLFMGRVQDLTAEQPELRASCLTIIDAVQTTPVAITPEEKPAGAPAEVAIEVNG